MPLRLYQQECLQAVHAADMRGERRLVIVLPTGTGKTRIASNLPEYVEIPPWQVMAFIVAGQELCEQAVEDLRESNPHLRVTLEKAEDHGHVDADIVVASVDTLAASPDRLARFAALPLRVIFVDECHGVVAPKWLKVLEALHVLKSADTCDESRLLVGLSATVRRFDGKALNAVFDKIVYRKTMREMIAAGWIVDPIAYRVDVGVDLDALTVRGGPDGRDFATGELSRTMNTPAINALVVQKHLEYANGLPAIAFTVDIQHSEDLAATFRHHGISFEAISVRTPKARRRELIEAHRHMELTGLASCQGLLQGFDSPPATVAHWVRPTCSGLLYTQGVGRVERCYPAPEAAATHTGYRKRNAILIDYVGVSSKHRLYTAGTLYGLNPNFNFEGSSITRTLENLEAIQERNLTLDISAFAGLKDVEAAATRVDLWKPAPIPKLAKSCSQFVWMQAGENTYRLNAPGLAVFIEEDHLGEYAVYRRLEGAEPHAELRFEQPEDAFAYADSLVPDEFVTLIRANARWRKDPPKENQCAKLWRTDSIIRKQFDSPDSFFYYATAQYDKGNMAFSKGAVSTRIETVKLAKERIAL